MFCRLFANRLYTRHRFSFYTTPTTPNTTANSNNNNDNNNNIHNSNSIKLNIFAEKLKISAENLINIIRKYEIREYNEATKLYRPEINLVLDHFGLRSNENSQKNVFKTEEEINQLQGKETTHSECIGPRRPPIVSIMGHVDHGKTTLLDSLRNTNVASNEPGYITQHMSAFVVDFDGRHVTFIDTPGHAAFEGIRGRGAKINDITVLVVDTCEGVKPQTKEVIDLMAKYNIKPIIALNKIDKENSNVSLTENQLLECGLRLNTHGGDIAAVQISALYKINLNLLVKTIIDQSNNLYLPALQDEIPYGFILETSSIPEYGRVVTVIPTQGVLKTKTILAAHKTFCKIRAILPARGTVSDWSILKEVNAGYPCGLVGWGKLLPSVGMMFVSVPNVKTARLMARPLPSLEKKRGRRKLRYQKQSVERNATVTDTRATSNQERNATGTDSIATSNQERNATGSDSIATSNQERNATGSDSIATSNQERNATGSDSIATSNQERNATGSDSIATSNQESNATGSDSIATSNQESNVTCPASIATSNQESNVTCPASIATSNQERNITIAEKVATNIEERHLETKDISTNSNEPVKATTNPETSQISNVEKVKTLYLILKSDVTGSKEALEKILNNSKPKNIKIEIFTSGVGHITLKDIQHAKMLGGCVIGYNVTMHSKAFEIQKRLRVPIFTHNIIYRIIDYLKDRLVEMLGPSYIEEEIGLAHIIGGPVGLDFTIPIICKLTRGDIMCNDDNAYYKIMRNTAVIYEGKLYDPVVKTTSGLYHCSIPEVYEFMEGDEIICFRRVSEQKELIWEVNEE